MITDRSEVTNTIRAAKVQKNISWAEVAGAIGQSKEWTTQGWSLRNRTRHLLDENLPASRFGERVTLQGKILVNGRPVRSRSTCLSTVLPRRAVAT